MHGRGGNVLRNAGAQGDHAREIHRLRRLADASEDHFVDVLRIEAGAGEQRAHGDATEFIRAKLREIGSHPAKRRPHAVHDDKAFVHVCVCAASAPSVFGRLSTTRSSFNFVPIPSILRSSSTLWNRILFG